jgi:hypothetical protein
MEEQTKPKFPTEVIELPSKGLLYSKDSVLGSGTVEMKYMTAREEDILTNQNYLQKGIVIDKLLQSMIVSKINYNDLLIGDKNAILIAARILGYGKDYSFTYLGEEVTVDLTTLENKPLKEELFKDGNNEFEFTLPSSGTVVTFKLLTHGDEMAIEQEIQGLRKIDKNINVDSTTRLKYLIQAVDGERSRKAIRDYVDNGLLARDARSLREYVKEIQPDVNTKIFVEGGPDGGLEIPFGVTFFWPDIRI